jgi:hypothetical protein
MAIQQKKLVAVGRAVLMMLLIILIPDQPMFRPLVTRSVWRSGCDNGHRRKFDRSPNFSPHFRRTFAFPSPCTQSLFFPVGNERVCSQRFARGGWQLPRAWMGWWRKVIRPGVFSYYITGAITASKAPETLASLPRWRPGKTRDAVC